MAKSRKSRLGKDPLSWVSDSRKGRAGKPSTPSKLSKRGKPGKPTKTEPEYQRATFHLRTDYIEMIKNESYWERLSVKDLVNQIFAEHFKGKRIKPKP